MSLVCCLSTTILVAQTPASKSLAEALGEKGKAAFAGSKYDSAIYYFTKAIHLDPTVFKYFHNRGLALYQKSNVNQQQLSNERLDSAVRDFSKAVSLSPDFWKSYWIRGQTYMLYYTRPTYPKLELAIADFTKALELEKNNYTLLVSRGDAYTKDPYQYYDEAIADYTKALQISSIDPYVYMQRAFMYYVKSDFNTSIADYKTALSLAKTDNDKAYLLIQQARAYERNDMPEKAVINYADANKLFPSKRLEEMEAEAVQKVIAKSARNISSQSAHLYNSDSLINAMTKEYKQKEAARSQQNSSQQNNKGVSPGYSNSNVCPMCNGSGWVETFGRKMEFVDIKDWQGRVIGSEFKPVDGFHSEKCKRCGGSGKN